MAIGYRHDLRELPRDRRDIKNGDKSGQFAVLRNGYGFPSYLTPIRLWHTSDMRW